MSTATEHPTADAVVIGAGPVGLFQVFQLGLQGIRAHVIDALAHAGGQCAELYADKPIYDLPGVPRCTGSELVALLLRQTAPFAPRWQFGSLVQTLQPQPDGQLLLGCSDGTQLHARQVFIAAGLGAFVPKRLPLPGLERFEGRQVFYANAIPAPATCAGLRVVVHGGEESAVAQAVALAERRPSATGGAGAGAPASVTLLHRREVFQAPPELLARLQQLRDAGLLQVVTGQITGFQTTAEHGVEQGVERGVEKGVEQGGYAADARLSALEVLTPAGHTERLPLDQLQALLGISPRLGPITDWGLALERKQLRVDPATMATSVPGIYAVGDINSYPGKRKLLVCGFHEATLAAWAAAEARAGQPLPLQYTTTSPRLQERLGVRESLESDPKDS
ncbi:MAG: NAD(P)/FAD-dependent oxidoreductase [Burkholderiaceae bacterium]